MWQVTMDAEAIPFEKIHADRYAECGNELDNDAIISVIMQELENFRNQKLNDVSDVLAIKGCAFSMFLERCKMECANIRECPHSKQISVAHL